MQKPANHETSLGRRVILYTNRDGRRVNGTFDPTELVRCFACNKWQPSQFLPYHVSFEHGINPESGKLNAPASPHYDVPVPTAWQLERM